MVTPTLLFVFLIFKTLKASGLNVSLEDVPGTDHFNVIENLVDGEYQLTKVWHQHLNVKTKYILKISLR